MDIPGFENRRDKNNAKMKTITMLVCGLMLSLSLQAQSFYIEDKSVTGVYEAGNRSKTEIYEAILNQLDQETDSENLEFEILDREKGLIVASGKSVIPYRNLGKILYPNRSQMAELLDAEFGHKIEIRIEDQMYLIKYYVTEMTHEIYNQEELFYNCVNFEELEPAELEKYNDSMDKFLKLNFVFKNKRQKFLKNSSSQFQDVSETLRNNAEVTLRKLSEGV